MTLGSPPTPRPIHLLKAKDQRYTHCERLLVEGGTTVTTLVTSEVTCKQCLVRGLP